MMAGLTGEAAGASRSEVMDTYASFSCELAVPGDQKA
jgi:hypothetical protein